MSITVTGKGTIDYVYDNAGTKLKKTVTEGASVRTTLYLGGFVYENDTLQLMLHEEGRIRLDRDTGNLYTGYVYDYFEKDHLGNVRVVLTEGRDTAAYPEASMETAKLGRDTLYYSKVNDTRVARSSVPGYPSNDAFTNPNDWVAQVSGSGNKVGLGLVLKVMAGDKFNLRVSSWYRSNGATSGTPVSPLNDLIAALIAGIGGSGKFSISEMQGSTVLSNNITSFLDSQTVVSGRPRAYINWVLFDEQMKYVDASSGFEQVPAETAFLNGSDPVVYVHQRNGLPVAKSGYLYIYVSNETPNIAVFFDNLQVTHARGPLLEETHYYPWGLVMAGISNKAYRRKYFENKFRFNDANELQSAEFNDNSGLELYDAMFRTYDPQIGRFHQIDDLSDYFEEYSPFVFALNNPILLNDPYGLSADTAVPGVPLMPEVIVTPSSGQPHVHQIVCIACGQLGPGPAAMVPFIPQEADFIVAPEEAETNDYGWWEFFNDHNPGGDFLYELNKYNPLANVVNGIKTFATGSDTYGVKQSNSDGVNQLAGAIIPVVRLEYSIVNTTLLATRQGIGKTLSNPQNVAHILQAKHNLHLLLPKTGGGLNIVRRLYLSLAQSGRLPPSGKFDITVNIYGYNVTIRGAVVNGVPRIGTAFIK